MSYYTSYLFLRHKLLADVSKTGALMKVHRITNTDKRQRNPLGLHLYLQPSFFLLLLGWACMSTVSH